MDSKMIQSDNEHQNHTKELKHLFDNLLVFFIVVYVLKFWNYLIIPQFPFAQIILVVWTILLGIHLVLFFLSTGILGEEFENIPVKSIAKDLLNQIKSRNNMLMKSLQRKESNSKP